VRTDLGVVVGGPLADLGALSARAEEAGIGTVWLHEAGHDGMVAATTVALATQQVRIGTDVLVAFARTPTLAAFSAWDLQELSRGRFVLGLGSQVQRIVEDGFSAPFTPPAPRMAEYVQTVKAVLASLAGDTTPFAGDYYRVTRPAVYGVTDPDRPLPPVHLAAVGPMMTRVAASHADGVVGHPFTTPRYLTDVLVPRVEAAVSAVGRARADIEVSTGVIVEVDDDRDVARTLARRQVAFYGTTPNYRTVFEANGEGDLTDRCREAFRGGGMGRLHEAIPDDVLDRYAVAGTPAEVAAGLRGWMGHVDHLIATTPTNGRAPAEVSAAVARTIDAAARAAEE
jgi:probable F420-dependent oxidoreductase